MIIVYYVFTASSDLSSDLSIDQFLFLFGIINFLKYFFTGDDVTGSTTKKSNTPRVSTGHRRRASRSSGDIDQDGEEGDRREKGDREDGDGERENGEGDGDGESDIDIEMEDDRNDQDKTPPIMFDNNESMVSSENNSILQVATSLLFFTSHLLFTSLLFFTSLHHFSSIHFSS